MSKSISKPVLQLTISLEEVTNLKTENATLKNKVAELTEENESLKETVEKLLVNKLKVKPKRGRSAMAA